LCFETAPITWGVLFQRTKKLLRSRAAFALLGGACLGCSFPDIGISGLAWIGPGLLVIAAAGATGGEAFRAGFLGALAHYLITLNWLLNIPYRWMGLPLAPAAGWLALSGFIALGPATWVWLVTRIGAFSPEPPQPELPERHFLYRAADFLPGTWLGRSALAIFGAAAWVAFEMYITRIFGGFPWNLLGASQYQLLPLLQMAEVTGIYGVSFLIVWFSVALAMTVPGVLRRGERPPVWSSEIMIPVLVIAVIFSWGLRETRQVPPHDRTLKVAMIQPSIPQTLIWNEANDDARFRHLVELSVQALTNKPDLLVWPEAAIPKLLRYNSDTYNTVSGLARQHKVWMIVGADDAEPRRDTPDPNDADYYNSSFLISPEGKLEDRYRKRSLVIFGEYIPLAKWLPFLAWFTPIQGGFTAGDDPVPFELTDLGLETSVLICFEDVFPGLGRSAASADTDFLVNLTNNGWFGEGAAQWQHAVSSILRAVENRRPLLRCTNSGLTCWVDAHGRIRQVFRDPKGTIYGEGFLFFELPLPSAENRPAPTFYNRHGDVFGWVCVLATLVPLAWFIGLRQRNEVNSAPRGDA